MADQLELFYDLLPKKIFVQPERGGPQIIRSKKRAPEYARLNPHHGNVHWLVVDVDERVTPYTIYDAHLPEPNIHCLDKETGTGHLYWRLASPVFSHPSQRHTKAYRYLDALHLAFTDRIYGGDKRFIRQVSKNPLHSSWDVIQGTDEAYALSDLAEFIPNLHEIGRDREIDMEDGEGRNEMLFKTLSNWAYPNVERARSVRFEAWLEQVTIRALSMNEVFTETLPPKEVESVAKSVARYIYYRYTPKKNRGRDEAMITNEMELVERQRLAAERTNAARKGSTEARIIWAMERLRQDGKRISKASVARMALISRQTVNQYSHLFER